jgi:hypothetical protein
MQVMEIDDSQWPLLWVKWRGKATDADIDRFYEIFDTYLARGQTIGLLLDSRGAEGLSSDQRKQTIAHMRRIAPQTEKQLIQAIVFDNPIQRALYFAVTWAYSMPFPSKSFGDVEDARAWLQAQLKHREKRP